MCWLLKEPTVNDVTTLRGSVYQDFVTILLKALLLKSMMMGGGGVNNNQKLRDVIIGRSLTQVYPVALQKLPLETKRGP